MTIRSGDLRMSWMTTILTFGGTTDLTLAELTVECFFPADEETERRARRGASEDGRDPTGEVLPSTGRASSR